MQRHPWQRELETWKEKGKHSDLARCLAAEWPANWQSREPVEKQPANDSPTLKKPVPNLEIDLYLAQVLSYGWC